MTPSAPTLSFLLILRTCGVVGRRSLRAGLEVQPMGYADFNAKRLDN